MKTWGLHLGRAVVLSAVALSVSCERRPQLLLIVDTDAPLSAQLLADTSISPDASVDTVRIDWFDAEWQPTCFDDVDCTANYVLPDPSLWPFSFGVATPPGGSSILHLRIRLFRGSLAARGRDEIGDNRFATIDPPPEATIDRLVEVSLPASGVVVARIFLSADCLGVPVSFYKGPHICLDASTTAALVAPSSGVEIVSDSRLGTTRAGTWPRAREVGCAAPPEADAVCIPGGFSFIGEAALDNVDEQTAAQAVPPRPVYVSPFWMDRTELTVGRFRAMVNGGLIQLESDNPLFPDPSVLYHADCTWLGASDGSNDDYPLNCLSWSLAQEACAKSGGASRPGALPTEAQWEHAARGRGQGLIYPWGNASPECCTASAGRGGPPCDGSGPEKVGSHPKSPACGGLGDVSRDGVLDLGGNVAEFCADKLVPYTGNCWSAPPGILVDPLCDDVDFSRHAARGGDWSSGTAITRPAFRRDESKSSQYGFRCVYPGGAQ